MQRFVSVIIPSYRSATTLRETVESVLAQTYGRLECLVIDDGSTDGSYDVAQALSREDDRVKVLHHPNRENRGVSAARNLGIDRAQGDLIGFLDSDDTWLPDKLERQLRILTERPEIGFLFSDTFLCKEPDARHPMAGQELIQAPFRSCLSEVFTGDRRRGAEAMLFHEDAYRWIPSPTPVVRAELFASGLRFVGPPRLNLQFEDFLMWKCLSLRTPMLAMQEPTSIYRVHSQSYTGSFYRTKSRLDHLRGLAEIDTILLEECGAEIVQFGWRDRIHQHLNEDYLRTVANSPLRDLPQLARVCHARGAGARFTRACLQRACLQTYYAVHRAASCVKRCLPGGAHRSQESVQ